MIQYIIECVAFQLVFLIIYDLFLKRETFFQWNRFYLIGTYLLSLFLPWIKLEAFKTAVLQEYYFYPEFLWELDNGVVMKAAKEDSWFSNLPIEYIVFYSGMLIAALLFGYKLFKLQQLKEKGQIRYFPNFTRIVIANSHLAFSFFRSIFLGDKVIEKDYENIIQHELVHIKQWHTLDLLFFELMRIVSWFNPLVYVYQNRIVELHEFIADAKVAKTHKMEHYQLLLSRVFQTENISFVNQFFKSSLIKKRIVMLQKSKSKRVWQLKYLLLVPLVAGMLFYTSCEQEIKIDSQQLTFDDATLISKINDEIEERLTNNETVSSIFFISDLWKRYKDDDDILSREEFFEYQILWKRFMVSMNAEINAKHGSNIDVKLSDPNSRLYESYVKRKKAFQLLDKNLKISINAFKQNVAFMDKSATFSSRFYVHKVNNTADLTGKELRAFNTKMAEVFEMESQYIGIIITDDTNDFKVFQNIRIMNPRDEIKLITNDGQKYPDVPFAVIDEVPVFPGCEDAIDKRTCFNEKILRHIRKHFNYPKEAQELGIQGRVSLMFSISNDGNIVNIRKRGPHKLLEDEAERIIARLPKMQPGKQKGKAVNVPFSIPITFKLQSGN